MELRWIEREIEIVTIDSGCYTQKVKVLQYWLSQGKWIDVPLGFEELDNV